jgi:hypothetical protein
MALQRLAPAWQAPAQRPLLESHAMAHVSTVSHAVPVELQTCVCRPLQRRDPAAQAVVPLQDFDTGSHDCAQTCWVCHWFEPLQTSSWLPLQRRSFIVHVVDEHELPWQICGEGQAIGAAQS